MGLMTPWLTAGVLEPAVSLAQQSPARLGAVAQARFHGQVVLSAQASPVDVTSDDWLVPNQTIVDQLTDGGMILAELRGGIELTTIINGNRAKRAEGDVWLVPAGSTMGIQTNRYSVWLHVVSFRISQNQLRSTTTGSPPVLLPNGRAFVSQREGVASRMTFKRAADLVAEVTELHLGPGQSVDVNIQGGALYEVREGQASVALPDKNIDAASGALFTLNDGVAATIRNTRNGPLLLHIIVVHMP